MISGPWRPRLLRGGVVLMGALFFFQCGRCVRHNPARHAAKLEQEAADYRPTALEVPLTVDYATAASKRVHAKNYAKELGRIERELKALRALR